MDYKIIRLDNNKATLMTDVLDCFSIAFDEPENYTHNRPDKRYFKNLLSDDNFICLAAYANNHLLGALVAYVLKKFEQNRCEIYIYDLAVYEKYRRKGIATALIEQVKIIAKKIGAYTVYVQADYVDKPAISLYTKLGTREEVLHFDITLS